MKDFLMKKTIIRVSSENYIAAIDTIIKNSLECIDISKNCYGGRDILVLTSRLKDFKNLYEKVGIDAEYLDYSDIVYRIFKYSRRFGLIIGALLMIICVHISSKTVWNINVEGNTTISDEEIIKQLKANGFSLGNYYPSFDFNKLHNNFLLNSDSIAWISVNMDGNVANVLVREICEGEEEGAFYYSNVVARYDGQIALIKKYNGIKVINIFDTVKKGDILISGVIDSKSHGVRYIHADGEVMAYVIKDINIKIPICQSIKTYTGRKTSDKSIEIFSKNINILKNTRNLYHNYDTIETIENLTVLGIVKLPIKIKKTVYSEYVYEDVKYSVNEVRDIAMAELRYKMDEAISDAELISKKINYFYDAESYYIDCELYCYENIAETVKFKVNER